MLNKDDLIKFYALYYHYKPLSPNIGIIGTHKNFLEIAKKIMKLYKSKKVFIMLNPTKTKLTIIEDGIETSYIYLSDLSSLEGNYFRKYM
jgi:hypothetical protein